ncbi:hypothetical protein [Telmatospirillum sp.]|uniref:hypothetical protein n=1 Tax=Telmatospirillum sp. TaxID=2079197 RepID=UPI0028462CF8|nr:hypothetical protein [Telmatospirillum sp.]MDR3436390.1 hypothetical protein [Telmatospirillum sp.]
MSKTAVCITSKGASVYIDGKTYLFNPAHPNFERAIAATKAKQWDLIPLLVDLTTQIQQISPNITVLGGQAYWGSEPLPVGYLSNKLNQLLEEPGSNPRPLALFIENLMENPSEDSREELGLFLEACRLPITDDGCFIGYKLVREDFTDTWTGTIDNSVGQAPSMDRSLVNADRTQTCSRGLHVCSRGYLRSGQVSGRHLMAVKVNPRDVVSVPTDYHNTKMRVCRYEVIEEIVETQIDAIETIAVIHSVAAPEPEPEQRLGLFGRLRRFFNAA